MKLNDLNLHDSQILKVIEDSNNNTLDFILDYPINYEENIFEKRNLRFYDFLNYKINEIPFEGTPTILEIKTLNLIKYNIGDKENKIEITRNFVELSTNSGTRTIEFRDIDLFKIEKL